MLNQTTDPVQVQLVLIDSEEEEVCENVSALNAIEENVINKPKRQKRCCVDRSAWNSSKNAANREKGKL